MDEIGMVITRVEPDGTLKVSRSGGLYPWKIGERPVDLLGDRETIQGVLSMGSTHIREPGKESIRWEDVWVITGLSQEKLQKAGIRPGTSAVPVRAQRGPVVFGDPADPLVGAWTFDDRAGVVTLVRLLEKMKKDGIQAHFPMIVSFTVHEEGGGNGAKVLAQRERPDIFIAVDGAPIPPGSPLRLDGRPAIWSKDTRGHYDQRLIREFMRAAQKVGTELQPVVYQSAASDASLVYYAGGAPRICCIGHARENSHGFEIIRLSVLDNLLKTLVQFVKTWAGD
jgi:putative aminopeptidase FrvX